MSGIHYGDMAVLVRSGRRQLGPIIRSLAAAGIPVEVAGDEIPLAQAPSVRPLLLALEVTAAGRVEPDEAIRLLTSPLGGFDALGLRRLAREWRAGRATSPAGLPEQLAAAINDPAWLDEGDPSPVTERLRRLLDVLAAAARRVRAGDPVDVVAWALWQGTEWPRQLARESLAGGALGSRADADLDALCALFESAAEADRRGGVGGIRAFLAELAGQQIPADRERESRLRGRGVQVLTAHRARGREWDLVVVAGVQEGVWPVGRRVSTVLEAAALTADGLTGRTDHRDLLAAERRLFHLACSRARRRLVVTAAAGTEGEADSPSRFLAELGVPLSAPDRHRQPLTLAAMAAELRRYATAPGSAAGTACRCSRRARTARRRGRRQRQAPGAVRRPVHLVGGAGADQPARAARARPVGAAQPEPGHRHPHLPASLLPRPGGPRRGRAGARCGAGVADPPAGAAGRHRGLGACRASRSGSTRSGTGCGSRLPGCRRPNASRSNSAWPGSWPGGRPPPRNWWASRCRSPSSSTVDDLTVSLDGKVDWLERTSGGLRVVDFKTSRTAPTRAAIAGMEQLGIYQLAVASGGFAGLEPDTGTAGAAAVYLRLAGRPEDLPKEFDQASLASTPYLYADPEEERYPTWVHQRVALAAGVVAEGSYPATPGPHCRTCPFANSCPASGRGGQVLR